MQFRSIMYGVLTRGCLDPQTLVVGDKVAEDPRVLTKTVLRDDDQQTKPINIRMVRRTESIVTKNGKDVRLSLKISQKTFTNVEHFLTTYLQHQAQVVRKCSTFVNVF